MVLPWPRGLVVLPCLAIWAAILPRLAGRTSLRNSAAILLLMGLIALFIGLLLATLLAQLS